MPDSHLQRRPTQLPSRFGVASVNAPRGGATILKVGGTISRAERAKNFFDPPTLRLPGGYKNDYGMIMVISVWYGRLF